MARVAISSGVEQYGGYASYRSYQENAVVKNDGKTMKNNWNAAIVLVESLLGGFIFRSDSVIRLRYVVQYVLHRAELNCTLYMHIT